MDLQGFIEEGYFSLLSLLLEAIRLSASFPSTLPHPPAFFLATLHIGLQRKRAFIPVLLPIPF